MFLKKYNYSKITFAIFSCLIINYLSGCGRPFIRSENYEARKREDAKKRLLKRHKKSIVKQKKVDEKLHDEAGIILIYSAKQSRSRKMSIEERKLNNKYIKKVNAAENKTKDLQKKYNELESEIKEIEQKLKLLGYQFDEP